LRRGTPNHGAGERAWNTDSRGRFLSAVPESPETARQKKRPCSPDAKAIRPNGFAVVSELCWLRDQIPNAVTDFFRSGYPDMQSVPQNIEIAEEAGYKIFNTYTLPREAWMKEYYEVLESRAKSLANHSDVALRDFVAETLKEIETFEISENSYGYVLFILQRPN
jgi:hypothetical protein